MRALEGISSVSAKGIEHFPLPAKKRCLYALFLNSTGRILCDAFLYSNPSSSSAPSVLVECPQSLSSFLLSHLKAFKLRSQVSFHLVPYAVWSFLVAPSLISSSTTDLASILSTEPSVVAVPDPRTPLLGLRVLSPASKQCSSVFVCAVVKVSLKPSCLFLFSDYPIRLSHSRGVSLFYSSFSSWYC